MESFTIPKASNDTEKSIGKKVVCGGVEVVSNGVDYVVDTTKSIIIMPFAIVGLIIAAPFLFWLIHEVDDAIGH